MPVVIFIIVGFLVCLGLAVVAAELLLKLGSSAGRECPVDPAAGDPLLPSARQEEA